MAEFRKDPEYIKQRREIIRHHHPDAGGSEAALIEELERLESRWSRRSLQRHQFEEIRPPFISKEQSDRAFRIAEEWISKVEDSAADLRKRADQVRVKASTVRESTADGIRDRLHDTPVENLARKAGRFAGNVRNRFHSS